MEKCSQCSLKLHAKHVNIRDSVIVLVASDYSASLFNCLFSGKPCSACDLAIAGETVWRQGMVVAYRSTVHVGDHQLL